MFRKRFQRVAVGRLIAAVACLVTRFALQAADAMDLPPPMPRSPGGAKVTHWSLKPVNSPPVPKMPLRATPGSNPIDAFVAEKLTANQLALAPQADRRTLIRRLYFDLIGLPPTPEEVKAFEQDDST